MGVWGGGEEPAGEYMEADKGYFCVAEIGDATLPERVLGCWLAGGSEEQKAHWPREKRFADPASPTETHIWIRSAACLLLRLFRIQCGKGSVR